MRQLALQDLEAHLDFGKRMRHDLLVGRDAKSRKHQPLVRHVVDHVGVVVGIDRAHPLVHARAVAGILRLKRRFLKRLVDVSRDGARLIDREIVMLQHRHAIEGMQREMRWLAHLGLEIPKRVRRALMGEDEANNVNKGAVRKPEYDGVRHDLLRRNDVNSSLPERLCRLAQHLSP